MPRILSFLVLPLALVLVSADGQAAFAAAPDDGGGPVFTLGGSLKAMAPNSDSPNSFRLQGAAVEGELGDPRTEPAGRGIRFRSGAEENQEVAPAGSVSWFVKGVSTTQGRWFRVRIGALAQENFHVAKDDLFVKVDFFKDDGKNSLDHVTKSFYEQVERERKDLVDKGTNRNLGPAAWRNYSFSFRTPFAEVDSMGLTIGFASGAGGPKLSEFWIRDVEFVPTADPADYAPPSKAGTAPPPALSALIKLGGRWHYDPRGGDARPPQEFNYTNADRLYYRTDRLETPLAGNTTAWLRKGYRDRDGKPVEQDMFIKDNVVVSFTDRYLVMKSKNLPNHPTASFPDRWRLLDGNPNYIQEQQFTWYIPLEPKENPAHIAMDAQNSNRALPGGAIGVAVNGIILHNPFDELVYQDAVWRTDRCCGHPSPLQSYHYHKYPVCLNTPWSDDGQGHSPLIGFAFDGFPVYGPYESAGELAKDSTTNPLNEFNLHHDSTRGPHYHVTPGRYPHLIGGFWGELETKNRLRRGPPPPRRPPGGAS